MDLLSELLDVSTSGQVIGDVVTFIGGNAPVSVQSIATASTGTASASLGAPPRTGNLLILRVTWDSVSNSNVLGVPAGFVLIGEYGNVVDFSNAVVSAYYKVAAPSDQTISITQSNPHGNLMNVFYEEIENGETPADWTPAYFAVDTATISVPANSLVKAVWAGFIAGSLGGAQPGWTIDLEYQGGAPYAAFQSYYTQTGGSIFGSSNNAGLSGIFYIPVPSGGTAPVYALRPPPSGGTGVTSLAPSGGTALTGAVVLVPSGGVQLSQSGQQITIYAPSGGGGGGGGVTAVTASSPLASSGGDTPNITLTAPLSIADGGTGTASPGDSPGSGIGISGSWPNETIANTGMLSLAPSGSSALTGAVVLVPSGGTVLSESGQDIIVYSPTAIATPVTSLAPSGSTALTGAVVLVPSGGTILSESGQSIVIYSPPSGGGGSGVSSLAPSGGSTITGAVTLSGTGGVVLSQSGQDINIYAPSGGGGGSSPFAPFTITSGTVSSGVITVPYAPAGSSNGSKADQTISGASGITLAFSYYGIQNQSSGPYVGFWIQAAGGGGVLFHAPTTAGSYLYTYTGDMTSTSNTVNTNIVSNQGLATVTGQWTLFRVMLQIQSSGLVFFAGGTMNIMPAQAVVSGVNFSTGTIKFGIFTATTSGTKCQIYAPEYAVIPSITSNPFGAGL